MPTSTPRLEIFRQSPPPATRRSDLARARSASLRPIPLRLPDLSLPNSWQSPLPHPSGLTPAAARWPTRPILRASVEPRPAQSLPSLLHGLHQVTSRPVRSTFEDLPD